MIPPAKTTILPNGVKITTIESAESESVAIGFFARTGSRCEPAALCGHSHFLEHMLFKGSSKRGARQISQAIEGRGGRCNAATGAESTYYYAVMPADSAALALDVIGDAYLRPTLAEKDVDSERGVIMEELNSSRDTPDDYVFDLAQSALWKGHPLGAQILGTPKTLEAVRSATLRDYHASRYHAGSTVIAAAGAISHEKFAKMAAPYALALPATGKTGFKAATAKTPLIALSADSRETEQVNAVMAYRTDFGNNDDRRYALRILSVVLGENMSSRLFQTVREKHGMAYSVSSTSSLYSDTGDFQIYAGLDRRRSAKGLALCAAEVAKILREPVGKAEFARALRYVIGGIKMSCETTTSRMWHAGMEALFDKTEPPEERIARYARLTPDEVLAVAAEIFRPEKMALALVLPRENADSPETHLAAAAVAGSAK